MVTYNPLAWPRSLPYRLRLSQGAGALPEGPSPARLGGIETLRSQIALIGTRRPVSIPPIKSVPILPVAPAARLEALETAMNRILASLTQGPTPTVSDARLGAIETSLGRITNALAQPPAPAAIDAAKLASMETLLGRIVTLLEQPSARGEALAIADVISASVNVGSSQDLDVQAHDLQNRVVPFSMMTITQVDVAAPGLASTDAVRLRIFLSGARRDPQDLVAEFDGSSQTSGTWLAAFTNRGIQYTDRNKKDTLWLQIRNTAGNSAATFFTIRVYGFAFR